MLTEIIDLDLTLEEALERLGDMTSLTFELEQAELQSHAPKKKNMIAPAII